MDGGEVARPQAPRTAAISEREQRKAKLRAELEAKKAKRQEKGKGLCVNACFFACGMRA